jgi:hypothetical protein
VTSVPGQRDEFDDYLAEQWKDPEFRAAYETELRRLRRAWPGYGGLPVDGHEYQRRLRARRKRRR